MKEGDAQALIYEYELLEKKFEELSMLRENLKAVYKEYRAVEQSLKELKNKDANDALLPLGAGMYVKASINTKDKLFVNVGAGIVMEKSISDALNKIEQEKIKIKEEIKKIDEERKKIKTQLKALAGLFS